MSKLHTIQVNVPICSECGGGLKFYQIANHYRCLHCGNLYKVVGFGHSEREFICEKEEKKQDAIEEDYQFLNNTEEITEDDFED